MASKLCFGVDGYRPGSESRGYIINFYKDHTFRNSVLLIGQYFKPRLALAFALSDTSTAIDALARLRRRDRRVFFDLQIIDNELLALGGVLAHVEGEHVFNRHSLWDDDGIEANVLADEVLEFVG